jgi:ABC-type nitrate/sulfonate/bicarbonate transport system permease component
MAGELNAGFPGHIGIGQALNNTAQNADFVGVYEAMIVIFVIGVVVDAAFFGTIVRAIRKRYGLIDAAAG